MFGNWDADNKSIRLKWNEGHNWTISIAAYEVPNEGEYKYIVFEGDRVKKWGSGENKRFNLKMIKEALKETKPTAENKHKYELVVNKTLKAEYDQKSKELILFETFD